jgi:hypothetical protein
VTVIFLQACSGGCYQSVDGYYIESVLCVVFGLIWLYSWGKPTANKHFHTDRELWTVDKPSFKFK